MACNKRVFHSPGEAQTQLRTWQKNGRRKELDNAHVYPADCDEHRGKFHIGRKHDRIHRGKQTLQDHNHTRMRERILDECEDLFDTQVQRILGRLSKAERQQRQRFVKADQGPLIMAEGGTLAPGGDELDIQERTSVETIRGRG